MPTFDQGAPGVRIRLRDESAVSLVTNPRITAGVVGYSSRGEFNNIIRLSSTAQLDTILGNGYNNPRFNQGLYAARSIINAGGFVEYVRPYGEAIIDDTSNPDYDFNQELKTDTFLVDYDFSSEATDSLGIKHFASTRYIEDALTGKGSRFINNIATTLVERSNIDFTLDAAAETDVGSGTNKIALDAGSGTNKIALFAIMNSDPSASVRGSAGDSINSGVDYLTVKTVATGKASKKYGVISVDTVNNGDQINVISSNGQTHLFEFVTSNPTTDQILIGGSVSDTTVNLVNKLKTIGYNATNPYFSFTIDSGLVKLTNTTTNKFSVNDYVMVSGASVPAPLVSGDVYKVASVDLVNSTITLKDVSTDTDITINGLTGAELLNLTKARIGASIRDNTTIDLIGGFLLNVPESTQNDIVTFVTNETGSPVVESSELITVYETTSGIVLDDAIGRTFLSLGLAIEDYQDTNLNNSLNRVFTLTSEGENIARFYLLVDYFFAGETYSFSGTILPIVHNDLNLYIKEQADAVANGWRFVLNENIALEDATLDSTFNLSYTLANDFIASTYTQIAYNDADPAIVNDAIWSYDPKNNNNSNTLALSWELFLDKDSARSDMLLSCGTAITSLFVKNMEQINYNVMDAMLNICEKRKDMFAIFDGVDEQKVDNVLAKMVGIGSQGIISRWGAIFDGRSIFFDNVYTRLNVDVVKSIEVGTIITLNRAGNVYWLAPAGETGRISGSLARRQKYNRSFIIADDPNSDISRLYNASINPTRSNDRGQFIYGQKTMIKAPTALNRLNVIMLIAGIHKRFSDFLDRKVFQLNTSALRNSITAELQAQLELIKSANPAGLTEGICICDETNNTPNIIDTNQLIVDIRLIPTRTGEYITLRTTVQRTGDTVSIVNAEIIGG